MYSDNDLTKTRLLELNAIIIAGIFISFGISDISDAYDVNASSHVVISFFYASFFRLVTVVPFVLSCLVLFRNNFQWGIILIVIGLFSIILFTIQSFSSIYSRLCSNHPIYCPYNSMFIQHEYWIWSLLFTVGIPVIVFGIWYVSQKHVKKITFCKSCNIQNPSNSNFCIGCGNPLTKKCKRCNSNYDLNDKFCRHCGNQLS